ncbi:NAD(P)-dependent dehydrogenase (short-subunit alcohol dehydrogenase family) [Bradyrhizobium macuxiense]|uniref:NAD(P)-dependent dehydrogenase (Short-subunit alcohol dehydrogenase family) n=1 Tax=Bradyrhizobium macuxiense TaxID=1755647 RepID=A0A560L3K4_9BRAD|nr:SDR family NAD(P)-dependent oxidoreductase [Bradyrhizobium macuxiense]TWB87740.1 NAD(P)-dependent dehydrogenase (short-subunit alcohol dehydrogenase family) [Bradyrhizobium macuxiense]
MSVATVEEIGSRGPCAGRLKDKVALITGAGAGMGRTVSLLFAEAGAKVLGSDVNAVGLDETARLASQRGLSIEIATVDASSEQQAISWIAEAVRKHGRVDVLYNNAASVRMAPFSEMTAQQWQETLRCELDVVFFPTKAVWPHMVAQQGGSIINIASVAGMLGGEGTGASAHAAGKGGVIALTRQLATEGAPHWIRVNSIAPGPILTENIRPRYEADMRLRAQFDDTPALARTGCPIDVAYAGLFLASDEALYITGVNLPVDGGKTCKSGPMVNRSAVA